ncbi:MAG: aminotransferase class V-fold PLP-dependent enzyme [Oscillospiraceae bacterium]
MGFYRQLGIPTYINAHDTYTVYGGSRMNKRTLAAMAEAAESFVSLEEMQRILGKKIAELTHNEGAYISNGAAGGLMLAAAVCMAKGEMYRYARLPNTEGIPNEIIVMRAQRNAYDAAILGSGAKIVEIGDADETLAYDLQGTIGPNTSAPFYFAPETFSRASMPLKQAISICHEKGIPVVVDAAAQLPPVANLWNYTALGADLVLFSGGKTLAGPQDSGLVLGRQNMVEDCIRFGAPAHGVCRASKTSREAMAGLYTALEQFLQQSEQTVYEQQLQICQTLVGALQAAGLQANIVPKGAVGQSYPRVFGSCQSFAQAAALQAAMLEQHIYIGADKAAAAITFSPQNLTEQEASLVAEAIRRVLPNVPGK